MSKVDIVILSLFNNHPCLESLAKNLNCEICDFTLHSFPDGESYIKINSNLENKNVIILDSLDKPDNKILPLLFTAKTARELGARSIGIAAPYLCYMRQDKIFKPGEGITSVYFAELISEYFDWLITIDPHLHRYHDLSQIYSIRTKSLHAISEISKWILKNIDNPVLIGPDSESEQWVSNIASLNNLPYVILNKVRNSDYNVEVSKPQIEQYKNYRPVLVDDIISTGRTMLATIEHLSAMNMKQPVCIGVHAIFANNAYEHLQQAGVYDIVTCNTIAHISNKIDVSDLLSREIQHKLNNIQ